MAHVEKHALVAGGLGVIGRNLVEHLAGRPDWKVTAISRRAPDFETPARFVSVDLADAAATRATLAAFGDVTHVFHTAYQEHADPKRQVDVNLALLANLVEAVDATSPSLRRVILYEGAKYYGAHLGVFPTPAREDDPRQMPPMFYYDQEDWLRERAAGRSWDMVVLRPDAVCGFAIGNPMNISMVIAVYAAISKELGLPLRFPGTADCYGRLAQVTDAAQLAAGSRWAAEQAEGGEAYNLTNGDIFRWNRLWERFARHFGMELAPPMTIPLAEMMADKGPVWDRMVEKHGLLPVPFDNVVAWGFGDFIFRCDWDVITATTKIRQAGFADVVDSEAMFLGLFDAFRARKIIP
ncbi:SDR family oxidoreductase [Sandaracinobacter sp. RS1-74]|uniref:SDR family oxidoreductase n=1 Tax=Sandaracinobacteroides sayramensis TaxID=2913411 RepID=UPI001ED9FCC1|nr:SDR family oxidoreductase [Sandaracinobacteroides sayramensis]MCG2842592.1 SDR family oxidoreductase [Sandaracinobacteroides sayramensis]